MSKSKTDRELLDDFQSLVLEYGKLDKCKSKEQVIEFCIPIIQELIDTNIVTFDIQSMSRNAIDLLVDCICTILKPHASQSACHCPGKSTTSPSLTYALTIQAAWPPGTNTWKVWETILQAACQNVCSPCAPCGFPILAGLSE